MNEKIHSEHLSRKAILYIRQSSSHQVTHHLESRRMRYAMQERLQQYWAGPRSKWSMMTRAHRRMGPRSDWDLTGWCLTCAWDE